MNACCGEPEGIALPIAARNDILVLTEPHFGPWFSTELRGFPTELELLADYKNQLKSYLGSLHSSNTSSDQKYAPI
jgi:hypothetical protein